MAIVTGLGIDLAHPFGKKLHDYKYYQINISNELFFTDKEPYFERNRMLVAFSNKPLNQP